MKVIIIGGVAGGASAAARARRLSEEAEIIVIERGPYISFANCGLPYHIGETIADRGKLLVTSVERMHERYNIDVRTRTSAESIDPKAKTVSLKNLATGEVTTESYDKLILSPGAKPLRPPIPGLELPGIHTLRDIGDMDRIKADIDADVNGPAVVVGAGFIGLEMAENLVQRGTPVTIVELQDQVMPPLDKEMTAPILRALKDHGVNLVLSDAVESFAATDDGLDVKLKSGKSLPARHVILSIGVQPESSLARDAGLEVGSRGGIIVNEHMQTSDPNIYAAGDAVEVVHFITGQKLQMPLAGPANRQGRLAADHIFGREANFRAVQGTCIVGLFGKAAAITGASEKLLKSQGIDYEKIYVHPAHHAGYYPGAEGMTLKLLFSPKDGKILGAIGVGGAGVDKRIDVIAMAIQAGMTVYDLEEAELCYAPQFGSAKDPVNMAGFVAAGVLRDDQPAAHAEEFPPGHSSEAFVLDVRTPQEFADGAVPGAVNIPVDDLRERIAEVPKDKPVVAYCKVGMRGYLATRILLQNGYDARNLSGGYTTWSMMFGE